MDDDARIVVIESSGFMGSVTIIDRRYAAKSGFGCRLIHEPINGAEIKPR